MVDPAAPVVEEEEEDPYNARIERTGCAQESEDLQICFFDKKDWRLCKDEMLKFRACFQANANNAGSKELIESQKAHMKQ
ncbi:uncharacterized protein BYT42DRAFT_516803 [Radiomyces spectabilis]|uniref:uncharacterized protein n=1 Tax=Radiomyces spectabilis TaxID=64574 RepID=UPI00221F384B|nr:uncharacterized protein BYT42DRAFT_516803 [Radiomyces spectabilis]KAI8376067.1 hypothetical protein BYT42DRAFT_516803 [Radiomyces spectabilis]